MQFNSITVVVGANDERKTLIETVDAVMGTSAADIAKMLLVRPATVSDECREAIRFLEQKYPGKVEGFVQTRPHVGGAIRDGFDTADTSHIMLLPGDMAINLDVIPALINSVKNEPETICKISRWLNRNSFHGYGAVKKVFNACGQVFLRVLFRASITDLTCPVQIMPTGLYRSIDWQELNFPFLEEMILVPLRLGTAITEHPAECFERREGRSSNSVRQTVLYLKTALRIRFTPKEKLLKR